MRHAGSGKTFTVSGSDAAPGLMPRALRELCRIVDSEKSKTDVTLKASMLELYQDTLVDLLLPTEPSRGGAPSERPKLDVKKDAKGWVTVTNITIRCAPTRRGAPAAAADARAAALCSDCAGYADLTAALKEGVARRKTASTLMNAESSRSHQIFCVVIESTDLQTQTVTRGKLSFVDLAGSERVKKSGATGEQLKEAMAINMSLSALGNVINALATEQAHVPYRDHRLTMLMSDSLGGSAKTLMFCNVSPSVRPLRLAACALCALTLCCPTGGQPGRDAEQLVVRCVHACRCDGGRACGCAALRADARLLLARHRAAATRVRAIKNDPNKNIATREVRAAASTDAAQRMPFAQRWQQAERVRRHTQMVRLQQQVAHWRAKAGEQGVEELDDIGDARAPAAQA